MGNNVDVYNLISRLKEIQDDFYKTFGVNDIISNSKVFEVLIANQLKHDLIPGHSGSRDAKNKLGEFEYKHYKETSSNHTWTFNDFSDTTIKNLLSIQAVIFAHIEDKDIDLPVFDWYYFVPGPIISEYLANTTGILKNLRKMTNVSSKQIQDKMGIQKTEISIQNEGVYSKWIEEIFDIINQIQILVGTKGILTSNKFFEILVSLILGHQVISEQSGHDAKDDQGNFYEYKVSSGTSWTFQDISKDVLKKYLRDKKIILATVNKSDLKVEAIYSANSKKIVSLLVNKLATKDENYKLKGKEVRRLMASISKKDLLMCKAKKIYPSK